MKLIFYTFDHCKVINWYFSATIKTVAFIFIQIRFTGYMDVFIGSKAGYYFSSTCAIIGSLSLFFIDLHRRSLARHKHSEFGKNLFKEAPQLRSKFKYLKQVIMSPFISICKWKESTVGLNRQPRPSKPSSLP